MFSRGKLTIAAFGAASLSGTLLVPASTLFASPAPAMQAAPAIAPALIAAPAPAPAPALLTQEAAPAAPQAPVRPARSAAVADRELDCLTKVILYESGSEPRAGQLAVARVVLNRMRSGRFPRTICGVIYQAGQFSSIRSFSPPRNARWQRAMAVAREALDGQPSAVGNALYFHAARVSPAYVRSRTRVARIGNHIFYR